MHSHSVAASTSHTTQGTLARTRHRACVRRSTGTHPTVLMKLTLNPPSANRSKMHVLPTPVRSRAHRRMRSSPVRKVPTSSRNTPRLTAVADQRQLVHRNTVLLLIRRRQRVHGRCTGADCSSPAPPHMYLPTRPRTAATPQQQQRSGVQGGWFD